MRIRFDAAGSLLLALALLTGPSVADDKAAPAEKPAKKAKKPKAPKKASTILNLDFGKSPLDGILDGILLNRPIFAPAVVFPPAVVADDAQIQAMTPQFVQQLRPLSKTELEFVRLVCSDLPPEQRIIIKAAAEEGLKKSARTLAEQQIQMNTGRGFNSQNKVNPIRTIREAIHLSLSNTVSAERMAKFTDESNQRLADHKQSAIRSIVIRLDESLFLSPEQQEKISKSLQTDWNDDWEVWLQMMRSYGNQYFPQLPDSAIVPHLTSEQANVWRSSPKMQHHWWWGMNHEEMLAEKDDWWGKDPEPKEKAAVFQGQVLILTE